MLCLSLKAQTSLCQPMGSCTVAILRWSQPGITHLLGEVLWGSVEPLQPLPSLRSFWLQEH